MRSWHRSASEGAVQNWRQLRRPRREVDGERDGVDAGDEEAPSGWPCRNLEHLGVERRDLGVDAATSRRRARPRARRTRPRRRPRDCSGVTRRNGPRCSGQSNSVFQGWRSSFTVRFFAAGAHDRVFPPRVGHLDRRGRAVDHDPRRRRCRPPRPDRRTSCELAVLEELLAPLVEKETVRRTAHLESLRHRARRGRPRRASSGSEWKFPGASTPWSSSAVTWRLRVRGRSLDGSQNVAVDDHRRSPSGRATSASTTAYCRPRFSNRSRPGR